MTEPVNLTNCDREPIHIPGTIQPHGALLAFDMDMRTLQQHSVNVAQVLGTEVRNGAGVADIFGSEVVRQLDQAMTLLRTQTRPALLFGVRLKTGQLADIALHQNGAAVVVEVEHSAVTTIPPLQLARVMIDRIIGIGEREALVAEMARQVRAHLGYDRVMIYEFARDGSGRVIAEEKAPHLESFRGQHFPASDIPVQARRLYLSNPIRLISDVSAERVPIMPEHHYGAPLDLSHAHLRSVSPIHCEYLRNMGVASSMSISLIVDGALWGLIACHHYSPRILTLPERVAAEMFGDFVSLHLGTLLRKRQLRTAAATRAQLEKLSRLDASQDVPQLLAQTMPDFAHMLDCDGIVVQVGGERAAHGITPGDAVLDAMLPRIEQWAKGDIWITESLFEHFPEVEGYHGQAAGLLAISVSKVRRDWILAFRREQVQTLEWAGNPNKVYSTGPMGDRLTPRKSFSLWKEDVHRRSRPWSEDDLETARSLRTSLVEIVMVHNELLAEERARAALRQRVLNDELNHRVKNVLAVIKSLVGQPLDQRETLESYVSALKGRIQALSFAHDQVMRGDGGGSLEALLRAELAPHLASRGMDLRGPPAMLDSRGFSVMAQVLHEMATNAAKYGALSCAGGKLDIVWAEGEEGACILYWQESGGPAVVEPEHRGFGSLLLERSLPFDLGGSTTITYNPSGVEAVFVLPAKYVRFEEQPMIANPTRDDKVAAAVPEDAHVMLLEDQLLIAMDVEAMLEEAGFRHVTLARNVAQAMELIEAGSVELAMLDVNLGSETSIPVAEELRRRGTPFVFATGYDENSALPDTMRNIPVVRKPYDGDNLIEALSKAFRT